jgi:sugar lactone lactonase YvrE
MNLITRHFLSAALLIATLQPQIAPTEAAPTILPGDLYRQERQSIAQAMKNQDKQGFRDALMKLHETFPYSSRVVRNLALAEADLGNGSEALKLLRLYAHMGMTLDTQNAAFAPVADASKQVPDFKTNAAPVAHGTKLFALPDKELLTEDIGYDPNSKRFILSSVHQRKIVSCDESGSCKSSPEIPLGAVLAIRVDAKRNVLWATSAGMNAAADFQQSEDGSSSLLKFDLNSYRLIKRYEPKDGKKHAMGDMVVAANGNAYVSDGLSGDVFCVSHENDSLAPLLPNGWFVSPQTPALSADQKLLYVPDYAQGIAVIRLADRHVEWLSSTVPVGLEGIDGLYLANDHLIAVQNGTSPERIVSFHLKAPYEVDRSEALEANWEGLGDPTHGVIVGDDFYFIVNSGWDHLDDKGSFNPTHPAEVMKLRLSERP